MIGVYFLTRYLLFSCDGGVVCWAVLCCAGQQCCSPILDLSTGISDWRFLLLCLLTGFTGQGLPSPPLARISSARQPAGFALALLLRAADVASLDLLFHPGDAVLASAGDFHTLPLGFGGRHLAPARAGRFDHLHGAFGVLHATPLLSGRDWTKAQRALGWRFLKWNHDIIRLWESINVCVWKVQGDFDDIGQGMLA